MCRIAETVPDIELAVVMPSLATMDLNAALAVERQYIIGPCSKASRRQSQLHRGLGWRAGPTLHRAQAPEPARPCARASARGGHRRLHGHDLRRDTGTDREPPQGLHPQVAAQVSGGGR